MRGQLWQQCTVCDVEPVCADCLRCERHCPCGGGAKDHKKAQAQAQAQQARVAARLQAQYPNSKALVE